MEKDQDQYDKNALFTIFLNLSNIWPPFHQRLRIWIRIWIFFLRQFYTINEMAQGPDTAAKPVDL